MKIESSFQPLNFWAQGPWMFFNLGLKFMQTWQNECFARLRLMPSSVRPTAGAAAVAGIAAGQGRATPMFGCLQNAIVVGGPAEEKLVQAAPVVAKAAPVVTKAAPVAKAAPAKVVAPKAVAAPAPAAAAVEAFEAVVAEDAPLAESTAPSVTSMLAMQAKSLAKAVKTTPPVALSKVAKKPAAKAEAPVVAVAAKPVAKAAVKSVAKVATAAVKPAAKAAAATKAAPAASKKA